MEGIKIERLKGFEIPDDLAQLTLGADGMMLCWLREDRAHMRASVLRLNGEIIAWACSVENYPGTFGIGAYVAENMRMIGLGKIVVTDMLKDLGTASPNAVVRYGAENEKFNRLYASLIIANGMTPNHCYGSLWTEQRKAA